MRLPAEKAASLLSFSFLMQCLRFCARARFSGLTKLLGQAAVGALTIGLLRTVRYFDPIKAANLFGRIARSRA